MNEQVNYDLIASNYNQRFIENPHQGALNALKTILSQENRPKVLEVGCGTGYWLKGLKSKMNIDLFGLDASIEMLKCAQPTQGVKLCQGKSEHLPFPGGSFNFVFAFNALHHFSGKIAFIKEAHRILSTGGKFAIVTTDPGDKRNQWYIYEYFEETYRHDLSRFPSLIQIVDWMRQNKFKDITTLDVDFIHDPKHGKTVLKDPFLQKNGCSQLTLLDEAEYKKGLEKIKHSLENASSSTMIFENDIVLSMVLGNKV